MKGLIFSSKIRNKGQLQKFPNKHGYTLNPRADPQGEHPGSQCENWANKVTFQRDYQTLGWKGMHVQINFFIDCSSSDNSSEKELIRFLIFQKKGLKREGVNLNENFSAYK